MINLTDKIISNKGTTYNDPKKIPEGGKYLDKFKGTKQINTQYNSLKVYINHKLESAIPLKNTLRR